MEMRLREAELTEAGTVLRQTDMSPTAAFVNHSQWVKRTAFQKQYLNTSP